MDKTYLRGDMYYANLQPGIGSEQKGFRPVVIIQNDIGNKYSPTVIVAAISSKDHVKANLPTHYYIGAEDGLKLPSIILLEQIRTIDKRRLAGYIGHLSKKHMDGMDKALAISTDLAPPFSTPLIMCLCSTCANDFFAASNNILRRLDPHQSERGICTYCNHRSGYDYIVTPRRK